MSPANPTTAARPSWSYALYGRFFDKRERARKRRDKRRKRLLKFPRSLSFTYEGKWFTAILLVIALAALNTGNNLLYLVVATLLSLIIVSGLMSESALARVSAARRSLPRRAFKDAPVPVTIDISNSKRVFPSFSFHVREMPVRDFRSSPAYVLKLEAGGTVKKTSTYTFLRRGQFRLYGLRVATRFPFGLFLKSKEEPSEDTVLVYPAVRPLKSPPQFESLNPTHGETSPAGKGDGTELWGLVEYTSDHDSRHIHWKSAARTGKLLVKEYENEREKRVSVLFENYGGEDLATFEEKVDEAATLVAHFIKNDYLVGLKTLETEIKPAHGREQLERILYELALIEPSTVRGRPTVRLRS